MNLSHRLLKTLLTLVVACGLISCAQDDEDNTPTGSVVNNLVLVKGNGDGQIALPYQSLSEQIRARVLDEIARPQSDLLVTFEVTNGGGVLSNDSVYTDELGVAAVSWQLGGLGLQTVEVMAFTPDGQAIRNSPLEFSAHFPVSVCEPIEDVDGNLYPTAMIGNKCWMVQNLRTTRFRDGAYIEEITDPMEWSSTANPAFCRFDNDQERPEIYGNLYNWYAVEDARDLCPTGWRIPTNADFDELVAHLGGALEAGGKMKLAGIQHWNSPNTGATNSSGFSAVGSSYRHNEGTFVNWHDISAIWTAEEATNFNAWMRYLYFNQGNIVTMGQNKRSGLAVRCIAE